MINLCSKCLCRIVRLTDLTTPEELFIHTTECWGCFGMAVAPIPPIEVGIPRFALKILKVDRND